MARIFEAAAQTFVGAIGAYGFEKVLSKIYKSHRYDGGGHVARCPSQHAFVAQSIAASANMSLDITKYRNLPYIEINSVKPYTAKDKLTTSLLGSVWVAIAAVAAGLGCAFLFRKDTLLPVSCEASV